MLAGEVFVINLYKASKKNEDGHINQEDFIEAERIFLNDMCLPQLNNGEIVEQTAEEREEFKSKFPKFPKVLWSEE